MADQVQLNDTGTAYIVRETERVSVEVTRMLFNDRIIVVPKAHPMTVERHWCYRQGPAAILAAMAWDGADATEPVGWIKAWDGRYSEEFLASQRH